MTASPPLNMTDYQAMDSLFLLCSRLKIVFRLYKNLIYSLIIKYLHREEKWKIELESGVDDDDEKKRRTEDEMYIEKYLNTSTKMSLRR